MRHSRIIIAAVAPPVIALALLRLFPADSARGNSTPPEEVESISIDSGWGGLGRPEQGRLTVVARGGTYVANGSAVETKKVTALLAALEAPPLAAPTLDDLGITDRWLRAHAAEALRANYPEEIYRKLTDRQKDYFIGLFTDRALVARALPALLRGGWTDDYPKVGVEVRLHGGETVKAGSSKQNIFMLPWTVERQGHSVENYDVALSRAIADLLPEGFTNRERIAGANLPAKLGETILRLKSKEWEALDAEEKFGPEIAKIRSRFEVRSSEPFSGGNLDIGGPDDVQGLADGWRAELAGGGLPPNVTVGLFLGAEGGRIEGTDEFLSRIESFVRLALSPHWLREYVAAHPPEGIEVRYVRDRSLSTKGAASLVEELREHGKGRLVPILTPLFAGAAHIVVHESMRTSRWVIFPDGRALLWESGGRGAPLGRVVPPKPPRQDRFGEFRGVLYAQDGTALSSVR